MEPGSKSMHSGSHRPTKFRSFRGGHGLGYMGQVATTRVPKEASVPVLSSNNHPNPSQRRQEGFGNNRILEDFQVPLNKRNNSNFKAFGGGGGGMARASWQPLRVSLWVLEDVYCHQMITQMHPWGQQKGFGGKSNFRSFSTATKP